MISSNTLTYKPYYYAHADDGSEYIVIYGNAVTIANEFIAHWLSEKLNLSTAKMQLVSQNCIIPSDYTLAIECIEGLRGVRNFNLPKKLQEELIGHLTVCYLLGNLDSVRFYTDSEHVYAFNYRNAFHFSGSPSSGNDGKELKKENLKRYKNYLRSVDFDVSELAEKWSIATEQLRTTMIDYSKRLLQITSKDIRELKKELCKLYSEDLVDIYVNHISSLKSHVTKYS